jgi:pullulanase/glycogen debranching enzyme
MVCLRNISVDTLHKGETEDNKKSNNNDYCYKNSIKYFVFKCENFNRSIITFSLQLINSILPTLSPNFSSNPFPSEYSYGHKSVRLVSKDVEFYAQLSVTCTFFAMNIIFKKELIYCDKFIGVK